MATPTPGPWRFDSPTKGTFIVDTWQPTSDGGSRQISIARTLTAAPIAEREANARLIAAAPDLAFAAKEYLAAEALGWNGEATKLELRRNFEVALKKAGVV